MQVFYHVGTFAKWTNVYHLDVADLPTADLAFSESMQAPLLNMLHIACTLDKVLFSSLEDDSFLETPKELSGTMGDTEQLLPLFNRVKVLFTTAGLGRPDVKFQGGFLTENSNEGGFIAESSISDLVAGWGSIITEMSGSSAPLVSHEGDLWSGVSIKTEIQMRQLHRRRRRATPPSP